MYDPHGTHHNDNDVCGTRREGQLLTQRLPSNHQSVLQTSQGTWAGPYVREKDYYISVNYGERNGRHA